MFVSNKVSIVSNESISGKRRARKLALQSLYQWLMAGTALSDIEAQFSAANNMDKVDGDYYRKLLYGIPKDLKAIEDAITPFLDRPIKSLNPIELSILRLCTFELFHCMEIPYRVILDESVSLAKAFGSQDGHRYVNGVLHNLAQTVRKTEIEGRL
jgi:transcription antitermination protein NusB